MATTEQITFLLFLKMVHEQTQPPYNPKAVLPTKLGGKICSGSRPRERS